MRAAAGAGAGTRRRQHATRLASRPPLRKTSRSVEFAPPRCETAFGFVRRRHEEEAGEEEAIPGEATEAPDDEGVPQLWSALHEDALGLDDFLHDDDGVEMSESLSDETIVASVRGAADSGESERRRRRS